MSKPYICYVAGKSGGHIIPAITHAQAELRENPEKQVLFFSSDGSLDRTILEKYSFINKLITLKLANVPRKKLVAWPKFFIQLTWSFMRIFFIFLRYRPEKVVSMGGYLSVPVCLVAHVLRIPIHLYELNVVPGEAVKFLSTWADVTHFCFQKTEYYLSKKVVSTLSDYPLRYTESDRIKREDACRKLGLDPAKKTICVLGGSQGSQFINTMLNTWAQSRENCSDYQVIHQTGVRDVEQVQHAYQKAGVDALVFAYRDDLHFCYAAADKIVARAGAGTLFEILFFKKPALIIPLEAATTAHQVDNAEAMHTAYPELFTLLRQHDIEMNPDLFHRTLSLSN